MSASLIAIAVSVVGALFIGVTTWLQRNQAQTTGAKLEAAAVSQATATAEVAIAQAEVAAPTTREAVADRLKKGTF